MSGPLDIDAIRHRFHGIGTIPVPSPEHEVLGDCEATIMLLCDRIEELEAALREALPALEHAERFVGRQVIGRQLCTHTGYPPDPGREYPPERICPDCGLVYAPW